jgi:photosystem II stability/assembly factor-like uncharacterized protein
MNLPRASRSRLLTFTVATGLFPATGLEAQWVSLTSGANVSLRGLSVVDSRTVWASGQRGTVVKTEDGGARWDVFTIPEAERLDVRAIHGRSADVAHAAATAGRMWRTRDGGRSWTLTYQATDTTVFLDAIDFWDDRRGMALGDPMGGRFLILLTEDGGATWHEAKAESRPEAVEGEAAFAASGSSLVLAPNGRGYLGSGGTKARLHITSDWGRTWQAADTPMLQGASSQGIFSVAVPTEGSIVLVGGDFQQADSTRGNAAYTSDGRTFKTRPSTPRGYRSGVAAFSRGGAPTVLVAVGPSGSDISRDHGVTWAAFDRLGFHAVRASADGVFFASGSDGRVARFDAR